MMQWTLKGIEVRETYTVTDMPRLPDPRRSLFDPEEVTVVRGDGGKSVHWVGVRGRKIKNGCYTETGYSVSPDGDVEPHHRNGDAPAWLVDLVEDSIDLFVSRVALAETGAGVPTVTLETVLAGMREDVR